MKTIIIKNPLKKDFEYCNRLIKKSELVAFPTETVYGLGANAFDEKALEKIFLVKNRPQKNPLIVHISQIEMLEDLVKNILPEARLLLKYFWPGPLTLVFKKSDLVSNLITANLDTVAVRMPSKKIALKFIDFCGVPIAAPSANLSGRPSPTRANHVLEDLDKKIFVIIDGGPCEIGLESTVLSVVKKPFVILRPGKITLEDLQKIVGEKNVVLHNSLINNSKKLFEVSSPGMLFKHYSPNARVVFFSDEKNLIKLFEKELKKNVRVRVKIIGLKKINLSVCEQILFKDLNEYAKNIFSEFRKADKQNYDVVFVEKVGKKGLGLALMNRLYKAVEE